MGKEKEIRYIKLLERTLPDGMILKEENVPRGLRAYIKFYKNIFVKVEDRWRYRGKIKIEGTIVKSCFSKKYEDDLFLVCIRKIKDGGVTHDYKVDESAWFNGKSLYEGFEKASDTEFEKYVLKIKETKSFWKKK